MSLIKVEKLISPNICPIKVPIKVPYSFKLYVRPGLVYQIHFSNSKQIS